MPAPLDADIAADTNAIHEADRRPQRTATTRPGRVANFRANHFRNAPPDFDARHPRGVPARAVGAVLGAPEHEIGLEILATPLMPPHAQDALQVIKRVGRRRIENVILFAPLVPAKLAV